MRNAREPLNKWQKTITLRPLSLWERVRVRVRVREKSLTIPLTLALCPEMRGPLRGGKQRTERGLVQGFPRAVIEENVCTT
jgi:hypothetical protein